MKSILATCLALSLIAGLAEQASAATYRKYKKSKNYDYSSRQARAKSLPSHANATPGWSPADSQALPFGSKLWWDQKLREGGGTRH